MAAPTAGSQAVTWLQKLIRHNTTNPPGNELPLVREIASVLEAEGLEPSILLSGEWRASLAVRMRGDGSQRPLLLMSHLDVVPAEPERWIYPPFAGEMHDGVLFGRGAIDSKLTTATHLQVLLECHRNRLPLKRDLVVIAAADEEFGGKYGMGWIAKEHPEWLDAEYGLNEGGGFAVVVDGKPIYTCQVAEKGGADVDLVVRGRPGHSSVPHADNPLVHLGESLTRLGGKLPHRVTPAVRAFFEASAEALRPEVAEVLLGLLNPASCDRSLTEIPAEEPTRLMFDAMLRNTCAPTLLEAGLKRNVIPSEAKTSLSGRPLPGVTEAEFMAEVHEMVGEDVDVEFGRYRPGVAFDHETPLHGVLQRALQRHEPGACVAPYMQTGGTDARFLTDLDITVYGFVPMRHESGMDFFELCHGHDERVSVVNVHFAVEVLLEAVKELNGLTD